LTRVLIICAGIVFLLISGVAVFAAGGLVAKYGWQPYASVYELADERLRALKATIKGSPSNESIKTTNLYSVLVSTSRTSPEKVGDHVAFTKLGSGYLVAKRDGRLFFVEHSLDPMLEPQKLDVRVPTNREQFRKDNSDRQPAALAQFGAKDILVREGPDGVELYASHSFWDSERRCSVLRLSSLPTSSGNLKERASDAEWKTVFDTEPCLEPNPELDRQGGDFTFLQAGGRIAFMGESELLLTVGDHFQDGLAGPNLPQNPESHIGKTVLIDLESGSARIYSMGHRNPQGLYVDREGTVWSTEHGPRGGDEINIISDGANYGWPNVTYGTQYAGMPWPAPYWGDHNAYTLPLYSWVPSVATCNIIRLGSTSKFPRWAGDLIVGTLGNRAVFRIRIREGRVVVVERIDIGSRVRDLGQAADGSLVLLTDDGELITLQPVESSDAGPIDDPVLRGQLLWTQCGQCHSLAHGSVHSTGPNLRGIVGSPIGRFDDFNYSAALKSLSTRWTEENLDAYLRSPQEFAPGNNMQFVGIANPEDRAAIIAYLGSQ